MTDNLKSHAPPVRVKFHEGAAEYLSSRNHKAPLSSKHYHLRIDGEPHNGSRPALTTSGVNGRDEIAECQALLLIGFHEGQNHFPRYFDGLRIRSSRSASRPFRTICRRLCLTAIATDWGSNQACLISWMI